MFLGYYWDWLFPLYSTGFFEFLNNQLYSWSSQQNLGAPIMFVSSYYYNVAISLFGFTGLPTNWVLGMILIIFFLLSFMLLRRATDSYLLSLACLVSPALFYKLQAGHFYYFISMVIFIGLVNWLLFKFKKSIFSYVVLGLVLAFVGAQIQFFIFAAIFLTIYFLFNKKQFEIKYLPILFLLPVLINLPWLSNLFSGVINIGAASSQASEMAFSGTVFASLPRIFFMAFSNATNIQYVYDKWSLIYFGFFSLSLMVTIGFYYYLRLKNKLPDVLERSNQINILTLSLIIFILLGTGFYQKIPIPIVQNLYPTLRESGHFAPIIILFEILVLAKIWPILLEKIRQSQKRIDYFRLVAASLSIYLIGFVCINLFYWLTYLPKFDYNFAKQEFLPFQNFNKEDTSTYRVLTYPFWNQYGFQNTPDIEKNGKLLNNSGWDSFMAFSGKEFINNYHPGGQSITNSLQFNLLTKNDISLLEEKNVKYLYDFQGIYKSNFEHYTTSESYNNDVSLIKNDHEFIPNLLLANRGLEKISENIYRLNNTKPRIFVDQEQGRPELFFQRVNPTKYKIYVKGVRDGAKINFLENYDQNWRLYPLGRDSGVVKLDQCEREQKQIEGATECLSKDSFFEGDELALSLKQALPDSSHNKYADYGNQWTLRAGDVANSIDKNGYEISNYPDGSFDIAFSLYFKPQTNFYLAGIISILTLLGIISWLIYNKAVKRQN